MTKENIDTNKIEDNEVYLYDKEIECPCCQSKFNFKKIKLSRLRLVIKDDLLVNHYKDIVPMRYGVLVCPNCGYAATERKFAKLNDTQVKTIYQNISIQWKNKDLTNVRNNTDAIEAYKLALYQGSLLNFSNLDIARLSFNLGCLTDDYFEKIRFLRLARDKFIIAYSNEDLTDTNEIEIAYKIAELSRIINDLSSASKWFALCVQSPGIKSNYLLNDLVREKWYEVKEEISKETALIEEQELLIVS